MTNKIENILLAAVLALPAAVLLEFFTRPFR